MLTIILDYLADIARYEIQQTNKSIAFSVIDSIMMICHHYLKLKATKVSFALQSTNPFHTTIYSIVSFNHHLTNTYFHANRSFDATHPHYSTTSHLLYTNLIYRRKNGSLFRTGRDKLPISSQCLRICSIN